MLCIFQLAQNHANLFIESRWITSETAGFTRRTQGRCSRDLCWHHRAGNRSMASPQRPSSKHQSKNPLSGRGVTVVQNTFYTLDLKPCAYSTLPQEVGPTKGQILSVSHPRYSKVDYWPHFPQSPLTSLRWGFLVWITVVHSWGTAKQQVLLFPCFSILTGS